MQKQKSDKEIQNSLLLQYEVLWILLEGKGLIQYFSILRNSMSWKHGTTH